MKKLIALALLIATPAFAQRARRENTFASDFQTVPVMANVTGNGGVVFHSYVALLNPTATPIHIDATLYDANGMPHGQTITLAAGELQTYDNFLDEVFDYSGGGAVTLRSDDASERFILSHEVRTTPGSYSTMVPPLEFAGSNSPSFAGGVTVSQSSRTNAGCFNQSNAANNVRVTVYDTTGDTVLGTTNISLPANAWAQTALTAIVDDGYVKFEPGEAAVCYAVVVSNLTNDGRFIAAAEYQP